MEYIAVTGGRDYADFATVEKTLTAAARGKITLVHGGCSGADRLAAQWAAVHGVPVLMFPAQWHVYGRAAGPIRNRQMLEYIAARRGRLIAFPGGRGTAHACRTAIELGIPVLHIPDGG